MIDEVEVGRQVAPKMRVAFEVLDSAATTDALVSAGAELIAAPRKHLGALSTLASRPRRTAYHPLPGARPLAGRETVSRRVEPGRRERHSRSEERRVGTESR